MKTLKEYANENHITYEAVRQQVKRYEKELINHIKKIKRTKYLDEFAIEFLDKKRVDNPVIIMESSKDDEIKRLVGENKALLLKVASLQEQLILEKENVQLLQNEKIELLEAKTITRTDNQTKKWWQFWK
nr:hypothetical protein [uncultured Fusobacterium sp.]